MKPEPSTQHHVIGCQRLEIRLGDKEQARSLQERVSQLTRGRMLLETAAVFSEICQPTLTHRLDRLVVDLGSMPIDRLEEEILARFAPRLKQALTDALHSSMAQQTPLSPLPVHRPTASLGELFEHLLRQGTLPWWAGAHSDKSLEELFLLVDESEPSAAEHIILRLGSWPEVRLRLIRQFSARALTSLVELLEPADASLIIDYAESVERIQQESPVVPVSDRVFHEATWDLILHTLVKERGSRFNTKSFLRSNVEGLAQRFGIQYRTLLDHFVSPATRPRSSGLPPTIETLLRELALEAAASSSEESSAIPAPSPVPPAIEPELLTQTLVSYFCCNAEQTAAVRSSLAKSWRSQPRHWQATLWELILLRSAAADLAPKIVALFAPGDWEAVHRTLPHPFEDGILQALQGGLAELNQPLVAGDWSIVWWERVFELGLKERGAGGTLGMGEETLGELLRAGLPQSIPISEAITRLLLLPTIRRHSRLRRALVRLSSRHSDARNLVNIVQLKEDPLPALALLDQWLRGGTLPSFLNVALPGGLEALLIRLELHHRAATAAHLRKLVPSLDLRRFAIRSAASLRRRILFILTPRLAPSLLAALEAITMHRVALFGREIGARQVEEGFWEAITRALSSAHSKPGADATTAAVRKHLEDTAQRLGVPPSLTGERFQAVMVCLPAGVAVSLARWFPGQNQRSDAAPAPINLHGELEAWCALVNPGSGHAASPAALASLWAAGERSGNPYQYRKLFGSIVPDRTVVERIVAAGGEDFFLWLITQQPIRLRAAFSAWLDWLEKMSVGFLPFDRSEWRGRALHELAKLWPDARRQTSRPRAVTIELLRRLGAPPAALIQSSGRTVELDEVFKAPVFSSDLVGRLKLWRTLLAPRARKKAGSAVLAALWAAGERDAPYFYRELLEAMSPELPVVERILAGGGESFFLWLVADEPAWWRAEFSAWLTLIERAGASLGFLPFNWREWRGRALYELYWLRRETSGRSQHPGTIMLELLRRLGAHTHAVSHWGVIASTFRERAPALATLRSSSEIQALAMILLSWITDAPLAAPPRLAEFIRRVAANSGPNRSPRQDSAKQKPPQVKPQKVVESHPQPGAGDSFHIENAGLVILSPFFARYHKTNGLLEDGRFRDGAAAERGVHLLQALLADEKPAPEQALVLNKVLCGLPPETPVVRRIDFTAQELALARTVLQSAIQNWPKVSGLSIDGFRGSFLWRRGKLTRGEDRWTLTIEQRGYDVLFSSLPWSFSVIKPSWMPDPLYVEWV